MAGMEDIKNAMAKKSAMMSAAATGKTPIPPGDPVAGLDSVLKSPNAQATPESVAGEADIIAAAAKAKFAEYDGIFKAMLPAMDKLIAEHEMIMAALNQANPGAVPQGPAVPTVPGQLVQ